MAISAPSALKKLYLALRCATFMVPWVLQLFLADLVVSALLPVSAALPNLSYDISSSIAASVWHAIQAIFTRLNGAKIIVSGDDLPHGESAFLVSNHVEWSDFYMIQQLAIRSGMLGRCRYFAKKQLKWVPFLGWGLWVLGMPMVSRNWMSDQREMDRVFYGVLNRRWPMWLISFSEATRFTRSKRAAAVEWCKAKNKTMPKNLLYPRTKGFIASVQKLRQAPHMKAVYDVTIAYARGNEFMVPPNFVKTIMVPDLSEQWKFYVHADRYELKDLPQTDQELAQWLEDRWVAKGERLEVLREKLAKGIAWEG